MLRKLVGGALGFATPVLGQLKAARSWLTLVAVAGAAAFLYWKFATVERDRDQLRAFAQLACASAGSQFDATKGHKRGELCSARVRQLAQLELDTARASNAALAGALADHANKSEADASAAARDAAQAEAALRQMERVNHATPSDDRVTRDWFDAFNDLAGLRRPEG